MAHPGTTPRRITATATATEGSVRKGTATNAGLGGPPGGVGSGCPDSAARSAVLVGLVLRLPRGTRTAVPAQR
jgi:hypothetical protein